MSFRRVYGSQPLIRIRSGWVCRFRAENFETTVRRYDFVLCSTAREAAKLGREDVDYDEDIAVVFAVVVHRNNILDSIFAGIEMTRREAIESGGADVENKARTFTAKVARHFRWLV